MGHSSSINGTWEVGQGRIGRMRKDDGPEVPRKMEGAQTVTGMTGRGKKEV